jgi:cob(I)alamin adenosyltransferase
MKLPLIEEKDIDILEQDIDKMNEELPEMKSFILPGGHTTVSYCHIARCICRRAERLVVDLPETTLQYDLILKYLNRLSDYLFVLSRFLTKKLNTEEIPWKPRI